jgi:hypothetical protein
MTTPHATTNCYNIFFSYIDMTIGYLDKPCIKLQNQNMVKFEQKSMSDIRLWFQIENISISFTTRFIQKFKPDVGVVIK